MSRPIQGAVIEDRTYCIDCAPFDLTAQKRKGVTRIYGVRVRAETCDVCGRNLGEPEPRCDCPACSAAARAHKFVHRLKGVKSVYRCLRCWEKKRKRANPSCPDCRGKGWIADSGSKKRAFSWDEEETTVMITKE